MAVSKVTYNGTTLIDLTADTVAADKLLSGYTAHNSAGQQITGTLSSGTVPANGSLIVCECSTEITAVTAVYGNVTAGAYLDTTNHIAYVTIPHTYTGAVYLYGYQGSIIRTSGQVTISGIDKYLCPLSTSSILFSSGTWTGYGAHEWDSLRGELSAQENSTFITIGDELNANDFIYLDPKVDFRGYTKLKITISLKLQGATINALVNTTKADSGYYGMTELTGVGTFTIDVPSAVQGQPLYLGFQIIDTTTSAHTQALRITKLEFV